MTYAFIQLDDDNIDGVQRVKALIKQFGDDTLDGFEFITFNHLPEWLSDTFSRGFAESAAQVNRGVKVTVARRLSGMNDE